MPPEVRDRVRLSYRFRGDSITLFEERPSFTESDTWVEFLWLNFVLMPDYRSGRSIVQTEIPVGTNTGK